MHSKIWRFALASISALVMVGTLAQPVSAEPETADACYATKAMSQKALGKFHAYVINVDTGETLVDVNGTTLTPSASVMKTLTAVAALQHLPEDYKASTSLWIDPTDPTTLIFKGGGDYTLSRLVPGEQSVYSKPPRIRALVKALVAQVPEGTVFNKIVLDDSFFEGESWNPDWPDSYRSLGYVSRITALQADGDRIQPNRLASNYSFRRSLDPVMKTGKILRNQLGEMASSAEIVVGQKPESAVLVAEVFSRGLREAWLPQMLTYSDNTAAEFIARHAAKAAGFGASITGERKVIKSSLREIGLKPKTFVIRDASGLSDFNRVHAKLLAKLMVKVANGENGLDLLRNWLPIAGETGTLRYRFQGATAIVRGKVIAKTGYIPGLYGLSGIVYAEDGSRLAFAVFARSDAENNVRVTYTAQHAIDRVITRFYSCGASLSQ